MSQSIVIVGGDARTLEIIKGLTENGEINLRLIGYDQYTEIDSMLKIDHFADIDPSTVDVVILPVQGVTESGTIHTQFSQKEIHFNEDWFKQLPESTHVFTGIVSPYLKKQIENSRFKLTSLMARDDVAIYNSIPTAEGTLLIAIEKTDYTIHSTNVIVTGYGRIGQSVAALFNNVGAYVSIYTKEAPDRARATERNLEVLSDRDLYEKANNTNIIINTAPAEVIDKTLINALPIDSLIIDLASKPGGTDFSAAESRGITAILAGGLPGKVAPKTSGAILADVIKSLID